MADLAAHELPTTADVLAALTLRTGSVAGCRLTASVEERAARAVLLRLADPGDKNLRDLVTCTAPSGALDRLRSAHPPEGSERWLPRLATADPQRDLERATTVGARLVVPGDEEWPGERVDPLAVPPLGLWVRGAPRPARRDRPIGRGGRVPGDHDVRRARGGGPRGGPGRQRVDGCLRRCVRHRWRRAPRGARGGRTHGGRAGERGGWCLPARAHGPAGADRQRGTGRQRALPGEQPTRSRFIERNRVIAAFAVGTVAVEMALRSGASATVDRAHDLGRVYMAVPGPVTSPTSAGCHHWIAVKGAELVTSAADVLTLVAPLGEALSPDPREAPRAIDLLDPDAQRLWEALPVKGTRPVADLAAAAGIAPRDVGAAMASLVSSGLADCDVLTAWRVTP